MAIGPNDLAKAIEAADEGDVLEIGVGEFAGPITIQKAVTLRGVGAGSVVWSRQGPVVRVTAAGVHLQDLAVEVTAEDAGVAILADAGTQLELSSVKTKGRVEGDIAPGAWVIPDVLDLGRIEPGQAYEKTFEAEVPGDGDVRCNVAGLRVEPTKFASGKNGFRLIGDASTLQSGLFLDGDIVFQVGSESRSIQVNGVVERISAAPPVPPLTRGRSAPPPPRGPGKQAASSSGIPPILWVSGGVGVVLVGALFLLFGGGGGDDPGGTVFNPSSTAATRTATSVPTRTSSGPATPTRTPQPTVDTSLHPGEPLITTVSPNSPVTRNFDAQAGQLVEIRADRDPTGNAFPHIIILDPAGEEVVDEADYNERGYVRVTYEVRSSGRHTVTVDGQDGTGPVAIRFAVDPYTPIESGVTVAAALELPDEVDRYTFSGSAGQLVVLRMTRDPTGSIRARLVLTNPFGEQVFDKNDYRNEGYVVTAVTLKDTGKFTLAARGSDWKEVGPYSVELLLDPYVDTGLGAALQGSIEKPNEWDRYRFDATAGSSVFVRVDRDPSGSLQPAIELYDPFGKSIGSADDYRNNGYVEDSFEITSTGRFTLVVRGRERAQTGAYTVQILAE